MNCEVANRLKNVINMQYNEIPNRKRISNQYVKRKKEAGKS